MALSWFNRLLKSKSRPATRRSARARLGVEALETRLVPTVFAGITGSGQLLVTDTSAVDTVTLDHSGSSTTVNGTSFADSLITNGIKIQVGTGVGNEDTVNILATVKPVTVDGQDDVGAVNLGGKLGIGAQGIQAPVNLTHLQPSFGLFTIGGWTLTVDDSGDTTGQTATLSTSNGFSTISSLAPGTITFDDTRLFNLFINGDSSGNTFNVFDTPVDESISADITSTHLNTGLGSDTVNVLNADRPLSIQGQSGKDAVHIGNGGSLQGIQAFVEVDNTGGFTDLTVDGSAATDSQNVDMAISTDGFGVIDGLAPAQILYKVNDVSSVDVKGGPKGNTFTVENTFQNSSFGVTTIDSGTGFDIVRVHGSTGRLTINGQNGRDIVSLSTGSFPFGTAQHIHGDVFVTNTFSFTNLSVNDASDPVGRTVVLSASPTAGEGFITGLTAGGIVSYNLSDVSALTINGGSGADHFFINSTAGPARIQVNGLDGNDLFTVSAHGTLDRIQTPVTLNGDGGFDTLVVDDSAAHVGHNYGSSSTEISRSGLGGPNVIIDFSPFESATLFQNTATGSAPAAQNLTLTSHVRVGELATLSGQLVDADPGDVLTLTVDWGDGSPVQTSKPDRAPFAVTHRYLEPGEYTVHATWTDSTGLSNSRDLTIAVKPARHAGHGEHESSLKGLDAFFAQLGAAENGRHDSH
jgi:hypothetical protein